VYTAILSQADYIKLPVLERIGDIDFYVQQTAYFLLNVEVSVLNPRIYNIILVARLA
jgi:hypothetical protein